MIFDCIANQECLFKGESSMEINVFRVRGEKIFDVHGEDRRIRKEIAPVKALLSEKLS